MIVEKELSYEEYKYLLESVGWRLPSKRLLEKGFKNSIISKVVFDNKTIGMARLITDGGYIGLIADVIVHPSYQGHGYGKMLINNLLEQAKRNLKEDESMMIQLLAADGKKGFYEQFGFKNKPSIVEAGMYRWL